MEHASAERQGGAVAAAVRCEFRLPQWYAQHESSGDEAASGDDSEPESSATDEEEQPFVTTAVTHARPIKPDASPKPSPVPAAATATAAAAA
jgi:hypothetical protein